MKPAVILSIVIAAAVGTRAPHKPPPSDFDLNLIEDRFGRWSPELAKRYAGTEQELMLKTAIQYFKNRKDRAPAAYDALVDYGRVQVCASNYDLPDSWAQAESTLQKAAKLNPRRWEAYYHLGNLYVHSAGTSEVGIAMLEKARAFKQVNPKVLLFLAEGYALRGSPTSTDSSSTPHYYALEEGGRRAAIGKAIEYLEDYYNYDPHDVLVTTLSTALSNTYWGHHIAALESGRGFEYVNRSAGFSFTFPVGWLVHHENVEQGRIEMNIPNTEPDGSVNNNALSIVSVDSIPPGDPLAFRDRMHKKMTLNLRYAPLKPIVEGSLAEHFRYETERGDCEGEISYLVGKGGRGYMVMFSATPSSYAKNVQGVHDLLRSIRVVD